MIDTGVSADLDAFSRYVIDTIGAESVSDAHGTMMMSVILGVTDEGIVLPSKGLEVLSIDVGTSPTTTSIADAINRSVDAGAELISISMGVRRGSVALETAVRRATDAGVTIIAAAGNVKFLSPDYPAKYPEVISVGAVTRSGVYWSDSVRRDLDAVAVGADVQVLNPDGSQRRESGTSIAAAAVTHDVLAALLSGAIDSATDYDWPRPPSD